MSGIIWDNIGLTRCNRWTRKIIIWGFALLLILIALILMVRFTNYSTELTAAAPNVDCANRTIEIDLAWIDYNMIPNLRNSDMHCYCKKNFDDAGNI